MFKVIIIMIDDDSQEYSLQTEADNISANSEAKSPQQQTTTTTTTLTSAVQTSASDTTTAVLSTTTTSSTVTDSKNQPKRLHVSNIPFRFRDPDLRAMFGVSSQLR